MKLKAACDVKNLHVNDEIVCPYCGSGQEEVYYAFEDGGHEVCCGNCDGEFDVRTSVTFHFEIKPRDGEIQLLRKEWLGEEKED